MRRGEVRAKGVAGAPVTGAAPGPLQMVVLMDPMEDPDDILRAHRSREKSYLFDVAFDFTATQVRGLGLGTPSAPRERDPPRTCQQPSARPPPLAPCLPPPVAPCVQACARLHGMCTAPLHGTHTAPPAGGPPGAGGRRWEPIWCEEESRGSRHPPGTPILPICGTFPGAGAMRPRGWGPAASCGGGSSGVLSALSGGRPPMG